MAKVRKIRLASYEGTIEATAPYVAGQGITIDENTNEISVDASMFPVYTAGDGIIINNGVISLDSEYAESTNWIVG